MKIRRLQSWIAEQLFGRPLKLAAGVALVFNVGITEVSAQTWNTTTGSWNTPASWSPVAIPTSATTTSLIFGGTGAIVATNNIGAGTFSLNSLTVNNTGTTSILPGVAANTLTFGGATATAGITIGSGAGATTISNGLITSVNSAITNNSSLSLLTLSGAMTLGTTTLTLAGAGNTTITGAITGTGTINKIGNGTVNQQSNSTFSGTLNVNGGTFITSAVTTGTFNFNPVSIVVNNGGTYQFGDAGGGDPNLPNSTFVTANTGGNLIWVVGESLGGINLNGGTLTLNGGVPSATHAWQSGTLTSTAASANTIASAVTKTTTGTVAVTGTALISGALAIQNGTVSYAAIANLGTNAITLGTATTTGTIEFQGATGTRAGGITLATTGGGIVRVTTAATAIAIPVPNLTLSGVISGSGLLSKEGPGILALSGTNTNTGGITIVGGGVATSNAVGLGSGPLTVTATAASAAIVGSNNIPFLYINNTAALTLANDIVLPAPGSAAVYTLTKMNSGTTSTGTNLRLNGVISGGNANSTLALNSDLGSDFSTSYQLSGTNTLAGKVRLNRGSLILDNASALGNATLELQSNANTVLGTGGNLRLNGAFTLSNNILIGTGTDTISSMANTAGIAGVISGSVAWGKLGTGTLVLTGNNTISVVLSILEGTVQLGAGGTTGSLPAATNFTNSGTLAFNRSNNVTYSGIISGTGAVNQLGDGTTILSGANTFAGGTTISAGTLQIGAGGTAGVLPGNVTNNGTLAFSRSDAVTFAGNISGTGGVTKLANNTTTLTGTLTYTGPTTISAGVLKINPFATTSGTTIADGAGLTIMNGAVPGTFTTPTLSLGATGSTLRFDLDSNNPAVPLINVTTTDEFKLNGGMHTLTLNNLSAFSVGQFAVIGYTGTQITSGFTLSPLPGRAIGNLAYNTSSIDVNITSNDSVVWTGAVDANWDAGTAVNVGGTPNWNLASNNNPTNFIPNDVVRFDDTAAVTAFTVNLATALQPLNVTVDNSLNVYTFQGSGSIIGTADLTKLGTNSLTLLTNNTNSGTTTITGGTLQVGNGGTTGSLGTGAVVNNAALVFDRSDNITVAGAISGTGSLTKNGANTLTLTGAYTSTGNTTLGGGVLELSTTASYTYGGTIGGAGGLTKLGTGTVTLTGNNLYSNPTTITAGTLEIGNGGTTGSLGTGAVVNNAALVFNRSDATTYAGNISGTGCSPSLGTGYSR